MFFGNWKQIKDYEDYYISDFGEIYSVRRRMFLKKDKDKYGYERIILRKNGVKKNQQIHRMVLSSFVGDDTLQCNHINGIKDDNDLCNLEYVTVNYNISHAFRIGLRSHNGEKNSNAKLTVADIKEIRKLYNNKSMSQYKLASKYGVTQSNISCIILNKTWNKEVTNG